MTPVCSANIQAFNSSGSGTVFAQYKQDPNRILRKIWPALQQEISKVLVYGSLPGEDEWSEVMRQWLKDNSALLQQVKSLDFSNLDIDEVPAELQFFTGLEEIHLEGNRIFSFPDWVKQWPVKDQPLKMYMARDCAEALQESLFPQWQINIIDSP